MNHNVFWFKKYVSAKEVNHPYLIKHKLLLWRWLAYLRKHLHHHKLDSLGNPPHQRDIDLCEPLTTQWMFILEYFKGTLKDFMGQNARPKGNMSKG